MISLLLSCSRRSLVFVLVVVATGLSILFMLSPNLGALLGPVPRRPNACECQRPTRPVTPPVEPTIALGGDLALPTPAPPGASTTIFLLLSHRMFT